MTIHIEELQFECIIGILDFERIEPQKVIIEAIIEYNYSKNSFINYADIISIIKENMIQNKHELLETALIKIANELHFNYTQMDSLSLKITKPNIINDVKVALSKKFNFK